MTKTRRFLSWAVYGLTFAGPQSRINPSIAARGLAPWPGCFLRRFIATPEHGVARSIFLPRGLLPLPRWILTVSSDWGKRGSKPASHGGCAGETRANRFDAG